MVENEELNEKISEYDDLMRRLQEIKDEINRISEKCRSDGYLKIVNRNKADAL